MYSFERSNNRQELALEEKIERLNQVISDRDKQIIELQKKKREQQSLLAQLQQEIETYRTSTSWRMTQPLRKLSLLYSKHNRLINFFKNYRYTYPGTKGYIRISYQLINALLTGGSSKVWKSIVFSEKLLLAKSLFNNSLLFESSDAHDISWLKTFQITGLLASTTIIFDHNGGGGTNTYTKTLVSKIITETGSALRIYPSDHIWFVQWIGKYNRMLFSTLHIEELFNVLSLSQSANIIINSLYGHPDISVSTSHIVELTRHLSAQLDFKIHDFNAICPSPHLLDFEGRYCGVPKDLQICKKCLLKNQDWYHSWYPEENKPVDIDQWRKPFSSLLTEVDRITFFDSSSIEIMRKAFHIEETKIKLVPHTSHYFTCEKKIDLNGALHIGSIGSLSQSKGSKVLTELHEYIKTHNMHIPITIVGSSDIDTHSDIEVHGQYEPNELPNIISKKKINVILMASIIPETFSYTLSEAMKMQLPVVAFDIGAQGNRVKQYEFGKVVALNASPQKILAAIYAALQSAQEQTKSC